MRKILKYILVIIVAFQFSSCNDWLTVYPENELITGRFWKSKEEVEGVLMNAYSEFRDQSLNLIKWGELRAPLVDFFYSGSVEKDMYDIRNLEVLSTNSYCDWSGLYSAIGSANQVIQYAPAVHGKDGSYAEAAMFSHQAEAHFVRALCYYYLVRLWGDVPYITHAYVDDSKPYDYPQSKGDDILQKELVKLEAYFEYSKPFFPSGGQTSQAANTKGRGSRWALAALIADINLWLGNYDKVIEYCDLIKDNQSIHNIDLMPGKDAARELTWLSIFMSTEKNNIIEAGNTIESIFQPQYISGGGLNQGSSLLSFFTGGKFALSDYARVLFIGNEDDYRLWGGIDRNGGTIGISVDGIEDPRLFKYIGSGDNNGVRTTAPPFIIYRYAEVLLFKAEALIMKGGRDNYETAIGLINQIRSRAGISLIQLTGAEEESNMLNYLLVERQREFVGEGKAWFDLMRMAKRHNYLYKSTLIDQCMLVISPAMAGAAEVKLDDPNSWYLPIYDDEMKRNTLLKQNSYYEALFGK